jgi:S1/P1 Nuclease
MGAEDPLFAAFSQDLAGGRARKWARGTVNDWAEESHEAGRKVTYGRLPKVPAGTVVSLDAAYERKADQVVKKQIEKAGVRLATVLNTVLLNAVLR